MKIAILYEHPEWFLPLFDRLDRRGISYERLHTVRHRWDPAARAFPYSLVVNRMSPSAYLRGHGSGISAARAFLTHVEALGIPTLNGLHAFNLETSKAAQMTLLARLGLPHPRSRVIAEPAAALEASADLQFPIAIKPNVGGSGAKIRRFDSREALAAAIAAGPLDLGIDGTALVQEWLPARGGSIVRVEVLDGRLLYAIRITPPEGDDFNLCPADICREGSPVEGFCAAAVAAPSREAAADKPKRPMQIDRYQPPAEIVAQAVRIAHTGGLDVAGIEYLVSGRDGRAYFYDINALSNFVTDAERLLGFDPYDRLAELIVQRAAVAAY